MGVCGYLPPASPLNDFSLNKAHVCPWWWERSWPDAHRARPLQPKARASHYIGLYKSEFEFSRVTDISYWLLPAISRQLLVLEQEDLCVELELKIEFKPLELELTQPHIARSQCCG